MDWEAYEHFLIGNYMLGDMDLFEQKGEIKFWSKNHWFEVICYTHVNNNRALELSSKICQPQRSFTFICLGGYCVCTCSFSKYTDHANNLCFQNHNHVFTWTATTKLTGVITPPPTHSKYYRKIFTQYVQFAFGLFYSVVFPSCVHE